MLKDEVKKYFSKTAIPNVFIQMMMDVETPKYLNDFQVETIGKDCSNLFKKYTHLFIFIAEEYKNIDETCQSFIANITIESMFKILGDFYNNLEEFIEGYIDIEKYDNFKDFFPALNKNRKISKQDAMNLSYIYNNNLDEISQSMFSRECRVRPFFDDNISFNIESECSDAVFQPNINFLKDGRLVDAKKYFFYEMLMMLSVCDTVTSVFAEDKPAESCFGSNNKQEIFYEKFYIIKDYAKEFVDFGIISE